MQKYIEDLKNKNIHIVGVSGTEGSAVLEFLIKNGIKNIMAHDFSADREELRKNFFKTHLWLKGKVKIEAFADFLKLPINLKLKDKYLDGVLDADIIFAPSSWYLYKPNFPLLQKAKEKGIEFSSLTKLYFKLAKGKIISITGTKGKGTTSRLVYEILRHPEAQSAEGSRALSGSVAMPRDYSSFCRRTQNDIQRNVYLAGNDRRSAQELDKVSKMGKDDILVLETSNRQLMIDLGRSPDIGVITNISPDHIDEHGSFEKYIEVKKSLFQYAKKDNAAVLNYDNEITKKFGENLIARGVKVFFFSRKNKVENGAYVENGKIYVLGHSMSKSKKEICDLKDIKLIGNHNVENILAAVLVGYLAGARQEEIKDAVRGFGGLTHRLEFIGEYNGVKFYDDIASTNPDSTIAALKALANYESRIMNHEKKLILVCGGDDKEMDYAGLAEEIIKKADVLILLPGTGTDKLKEQFSIFNFQFSIKSQIPIFKQNNCHPDPPVGGEGSLANASSFRIFECNDFSEAMNLIKKQTKAGDIVLISPACAHFQARYIDVFKKSIRNLIVEKFR